MEYCAIGGAVSKGLNAIVLRCQEWCSKDRNKGVVFALEAALLAVYIYMCINAGYHADECADGTMQVRWEEPCETGNACNVPLGQYISVEGWTGIPFILLIGKADTSTERF